MGFFGSSLQIPENTQTPKTDAQIVSCFQKSRNLVRGWTVVLFIAAVFSLCLYYQLKEGRWSKTVFFSAWGTILGASTLIGVAYNLISLAGMKSTCNCLKTCGDAKTIAFLIHLKKLRFYTLLDIVFVLLGPVKMVTTVMIRFHAHKLKSMLKDLDSGQEPKLKN